MKCDELKPITVTDECGSYRVYNKSDVDAAIDELKAAHHKERHEYIKMIAELKQKLQDQCISCPVKEQEDDVVAELKQKLEDAKATAYAESVDAGMRERRLIRALWLARATIANSTKYKYHRLACKAEIDPQPHGWSCYINGEVYRTGKMNRKLEPYYWTEIWGEVERKCRAKAEEYK